MSKKMKKKAGSELDAEELLSRVVNAVKEMGEATDDKLELMAKATDEKIETLTADFAETKRVMANMPTQQEQPQQQTDSKGLPLTDGMKKKFNDASLGELVAAWRVVKEPPADPFADLGSELVKDALGDLIGIHVKKKANERFARTIPQPETSQQ